jgi:nitrate reductase molybdenum cofactor assembly chaperone
VRAVLHRLAAMRSYMRKREVLGEIDEQLPGRVGLTGPELERMYRLLAIADYEDRYVIPQAHAELGERLMQEQGGCGLDFDGGPGNCGAVDPRPDTSSPVVPYDGESFHLLDILKRNEHHGAMRRRTPPPPPAPWALLSFLLRYPTPAWPRARRARRRGVGAARRAGTRRARALPRRLDGDQTALAARYVETFDLRRRASLYLTYYEHGDTRERGTALLRLKKLYRAAGLPMNSSELPDHLTVMLAFAALAPAGHGEALLAEHRAAIELLRLSLHDLSSPYANVLDAIAAGLPALNGDRALRGGAAGARGATRGGRRPGALRAAGGHARGSARMSAGEILLWIIFPYAAVTTFVVGTWWRYRVDQFGWTSGSTQLLSRRSWAGRDRRFTTARSPPSAGTSSG